MKYRVWWKPQVPMNNSFHVEVPTAEEGARLLRTLAYYDFFQYENRIKPDYSNAGGLEMFVDGEWMDWMDEETGEDDPDTLLEDDEEVDDGG